MNLYKTCASIYDSPSITENVEIKAQAPTTAIERCPTIWLEQDDSGCFLVYFINGIVVMSNKKENSESKIL